MAVLPDKYLENVELLRRAQNGDQAARTRVYENNLGLVRMVLERFRNTNCDHEDLFQVGSIGLIKAMDKFDFTYQVRFSTYAVPMIIGEIKKFLRDDGIIKVQRGLKESYGKIRWAQEKLRADLGREPTINELAELLHMDREEIVMAAEACQSPAYIYDSYIGEEKDQLSLLDRLASDQGNIMMLERLALREALDKLGSREKEVIIRRFFKDETQAAIAADMGVSQVQVSRIEKAALSKLKRVLE